MVQTAWDVRGCCRYYYRSVREGGRVRRIYVGTGLVAATAAEFDKLARAIRDSARQRSRAARAVERQRLDAALVDAGYHRPHRGAWRRRREPC